MMKVIDGTRTRCGTARLYWPEMSIPAFQMLILNFDSSKFLISDINTSKICTRGLIEGRWAQSFFLLPLSLGC